MHNLIINNHNYHVATFLTLCKKKKKEKETYHYTFFFFLAQISIYRWLCGKESVCQCRRSSFDSWVRKILWRRIWQPTPVFLPGKAHEQRSLVGHSPWGHKIVGHYLAARQHKYFIVWIHIHSFVD